MAGGLTAEQIVALAPDAGAARAATGLAAPRHWPRLGSDDAATWGECQGSAREPYQTAVELSGPVFRCSCPSRKLPCKHGLGLLLLLVRQPAAFAAGPPPGWVAEWLASRAGRAQRRGEKELLPAAPVDAAGQERRAARRGSRVAAGVTELEHWLADLARQGLASAQAQPLTFWEGPAARMVDAQAPGLGRCLRELAAIPSSGDGWPGRLLEQLGRLHLLLGAFRRLEALPPGTQEDVRALIGWTESQDALRGEAGVHDRWAVLGQRVEDDGRLRSQRSWLWGSQSGRAALVLQYAAAGQSLDVSLSPGSAIDGELVFYPGAEPLRALVKERLGQPAPLEAMPAGAGVAEAVAAYASGLAGDPWLHLRPMLLDAVVPGQADGGFFVQDRDGRALPLRRDFAQPWQLLALSGGHPLALFGEWDGDDLLPLAAWADGEFQRL